MGRHPYKYQPPPATRFGHACEPIVGGGLHQTEAGGLHYANVVDTTKSSSRLRVVDMDVTVAVTGATSGIGRAVATAFIKQGATVAVSGRDGAAVEKTVDALSEIDASTDSDASGTAWGTRADVRDEFDLERFFERAATEMGPIDVVVANAAVFEGAPGESPIDRVSYETFDDTMRTNARGVFATITEAVPHLAADARVLVPSGSVAHEVKPGMGAYGVSKAAAEAVARSFAADLDATVSVVDPGLVATDLTGMERARDPESVAPLFVWAATAAPADDLDGDRIGLREWKRATR